MSLLNRVFPKELNNHFYGHKLSLYVFYVLTAITLWRSLHHLLAPDGGAQSIATIPLDTFSQTGAQAVVGAFGLWGLSQLVVGLLYLVGAIRYRSMIPLLYLLMFLEYFVRAVYFPLSKQIPTAGTAPGAISNLPMIVLSLGMFVLSVKKPKDG